MHKQIVTLTLLMGAFNSPLLNCIERWVQANGKRSNANQGTRRMVAVVTCSKAAKCTKGVRAVDTVTAAACCSLFFHESFSLSLSLFRFSALFVLPTPTSRGERQSRCRCSRSSMPFNTIGTQSERLPLSLVWLHVFCSVTHQFQI